MQHVQDPPTRVDGAVTRETVSETIPADERIRLRTVVRLRVARDGNLVSVDVVKPSGNALYDNAVLTAVKRAEPFSPPPEHLRDLLKRGVSMEFEP